MRQLLPFERYLINELGISEADYEQFLIVQEQNRIAYAKNPPAIVNGDPVSIVLAVVGIIFQVVALLLRPGRPAGPDLSQSREQRFSPTFGFNSVQEVAKYGDPINLVYTNTDDNPDGGVRVNTSLVWSNVFSYGNGQYGQFLSVIGAGEIVSIRPTLTGIGQGVVSQQPSSRYWVYWKNGAGTDNRIVGSNLVQGSSVDPGFPAGANNLVYAITPGGSNTRTEGFSQSFSPTTSNSLGVFSPFGVSSYNVFVVNGSPSSVDIGITVDATTLATWSANGILSTGTFVSVSIASTSSPGADASNAAADARRAAAQSIDAGSLYVFGSAILEFYDFLSTNVDTDDGQVVVRFRVVRAGYPPSCPPGTTSNNNWLPTKCISKIEIARYETLSKCNVVDLCFKARIFRRINDTRDTNKPKSGIKIRQFFFKLSYKKRSASSFTRVPGYFVIRRGADTDTYSFLKFVPATADTYVFELEPVQDIPSDQNLAGGSSVFYYIDQAVAGGAVNYRSITIGTDKFFYAGQETNSLETGNIAENGLEWELVSYSSNFSITVSSDSGPEVSIGVVNEQQIDTRSDKSLYNQLSVIGLNIFSGKNLQDLRQVSAFVDKGKKVRRLNPNATQEPYYPSSPDGASSYPPDVFLDTVLDDVNGVGGLVDIEAIDIPTLVESKRFCIANNIFFDGLFAERTNWRQYWASNAPLMLHELVKVNGKEAIRPAIPYDPETGNITRQVNISELYNESNILEDSYKEEFLDFGENTRDIEATIIYREFVDQSSPSSQTARNFPINRTVIVKRADSSEDDIVRQQFNLSGFCTTREQAILFGKFVSNLRRYQRRACEFKTIPTLTAIAPGEYIYVQLGQITWDNAKTGVVGRNGTLVSPAISQSYTELTNILLYKSGGQIVRIPNILVEQGRSDLLSAYEGYLFVLGSSLNTKRCFRVEEVQIDEEGVVSVRALEYPLDIEGLSLVAKLDDSDFVVV